MKSFRELLEMQKELDEAIEKPRQNGFVPRKRKVTDILLALDDEFQEWLRELPQEYNFKTWKIKEYNRERELEELTDVLFFFLQLANFRTFPKIDYCFLADYFDNTEEYSYRYPVMHYVKKLKKRLWEEEGVASFYYYMGIVKTRGFTREEIIDCYVAKWQKNMDRINGEWSNI